MKSVFSGYFVYTKSQQDLEFESMFGDESSYGEEIKMLL